MKFLVTGGAGFIGSSLVEVLLRDKNNQVINFDKFTYAGNLKSLENVIKNKNFVNIKGDICDNTMIRKTLAKYKPDKIIHLAAESHVDRSIDGPGEFINTNIVGTYVLLEEARHYWLNLKNEMKDNFTFHHVSTDEVYGDLEKNDPPFTENNPYIPSSPYSASKASSDHLVRAWHRTFNLPILITNCSNNYGPRQFPEKLIPLIILNSITGKQLPVYGSGLQIRDWLYVEDHARAIIEVSLKGKIGETYNIGGNNEIANIEVVKLVCKILEKLNPKKPKGIQNYEELITYVTDRPGHDKRYAIDNKKINDELKWTPKETFNSGIEKTISWYLSNNDWCTEVVQNNDQTKRLGIIKKS